MTTPHIIPTKKSPRYNLGDLEAFKIYKGSKWRVAKNMNSLVVIGRSLNLNTGELTLRTYTWETEEFSNVNADQFIDGILFNKIKKY